MNSILLLLPIVCILWRITECQCVIPHLCTQLHGTYIQQSNKTRVYIPPSLRSSADDGRITCLIFSKGEYTCKTHSLDNLYLDINGKLTDLHDVRVVTSNNAVAETTLFVPSTGVFQLEDYISITYPQYGQLMNNRLEVIFATSNASAFDSVHFTAVDFFDQHLAADTVYLDYRIQDKEIGSWFYEISTARLDEAQSQTAFGYPAYGYVEFVLTESEIATSRYFVDGTTETAPLIFGESAQTSSSNARIRTKNPVRVCLFNGPKLDGQKQIWRQQSLHLDPDRFLLIWLLSEDAPGDLTLDYIANIPNIEIATNPKLPVSLHELHEVPEDGGLSAAATWDGNSTFLFLYAHERLKRAQYHVENISPAWCQRFYRLMRAALLSNNCEVAVYGNTRGFSSDVLVTDTAKLLGLPVVAELLNLYMHELVLPDVIVAPSQYALRHDSMQVVVGGAHCVHSSVCCLVPSAVVVAPSVDTQLFSRDNISHSDVYRHPACHRQPAAEELELEKNPGLFLQMAQHLLQLHPFVRFTVVGDGALRTALEELAARLRISWAVHFTGWVSTEELPAVLADMDVVVNPGLVLETFCISNIEVMSMGVPLVTFAVGGIGEYVAAPPADQHSRKEEQSEGVGADFSVSANAVVVHRASPDALARAVLHLLLRPALRRELGAAGRGTVLARFTVQRQMQQYSDLYQHIVTAAGRKRC